MARLFSIDGVSWLAVLWITSLPLSSLSHAQPLPKRPVAAAAKISLNVSKLPKVDVMASAIAPVGAPPALGAISVQNCVWFAVAAAVVADRGADAVRHLVQVLQHLVQRHPARRAGGRHGGVQVGHVGLMMPIVVDLHRLGVDVRLERRERDRAAAAA